MPSDGPTSLYSYFDAFDVLIYVGITGQGTARNGQHNRDKDWWPLVARQDVAHYRSRPEAEQAERALIAARRPPFNTQHNPDHAELRTAYLAFTERANGEPIRRLRELGNEIPLLRHEFGVYRTHLDDTPLAVMVKQVDVVKVCDATGLRCGRVKSIASHGPLLLIAVELRRGLDPLTAVAKVKRPPRSKSLVIRHIRI